MKKTSLFLIVLLLSNLLPAQSKIALVIGNSNYQQVPLKNPVNDAYDLSSALRSVGFEVIHKTNLNRRSMEDAIRDFKNSINPGDVALFYFSGHGTQVNGLNYLIPVNESVNNEIDVKYYCVNAGFVLDNMEQAGSGINIIILDACRNNPFKGQRSVSRGFAFMSAPAGSIIAYSTSPGSVALDGDGRNSPFTGNFIEKIKLPGLKIEEVFKEVRKDVAVETNRRQIPWESSSLMGDFYFTKGTAIINSYNTPSNTITNKPTAKPKQVPHEGYNGNSGTFTDTRDGQRYKWVRIGKQIWMAENLNYSTKDSWCYINKQINCDKYGRLYNWEAAKKACPVGWHLPSDDEWKQLEMTLGMSQSEANKTAYRGTNEGKKMKSIIGWNKNGNGTNSSGFNALPGGYRNSSGSFYGLGNYGGWWSSTEYSGTGAWYRSLFYNNGQVYRYYNLKTIGFSVRCLKN